MNINRLQPFGGEVTDVDLVTCSDDSLEEILMTLYDERFLAIRTGGLSDADFVRFAYRVGDPIRLRERAEPPEIFPVTNVDVDTAKVSKDSLMVSAAPINHAAHWHTDLSFTKIVASITMLYSVAAPKKGGATRFCNMAAAYDALPESMKSEIDELTVEHRHGVSVSARPDDHSPVPPEGWDQSVTVFHPLVRRHPITGRKTLYAITGTSQGIKDMDHASGVKLLNDLCEHTFQERFVSLHQHRPEDLVMWDNPTTMHKATPFHTATGPDDTRIIRRISLRGTPSIFSP